MNVLTRSLPLKALLIAMVPLLSGCMTKTFETYYEAPAPRDEVRNWRLAGVRVSVPEKLTVSEEHTYEPPADIVWREDPIGDRHPQVAAIMKTAVERGAKGLHGGRPVWLDIQVTRFHALTFEAESLNMAGVGVHNVEFYITVVDARSGKRLAGPEFIDAAMPALTGAEMIQARLRGESQRSQITNHVARTVAGWLGIGPDQRGSFVRVGR